MSLRRDTTKLAAKVPELRKHLVPLLKKSYGRVEFEKAEYSCGFAITTADEYVIRENIREDVRRYPREFKEFIGKGYVTADGEITDIGWDVLNEEGWPFAERAAVKWLDRTFNSAGSEGHGGQFGDDLIGTLYFNPSMPAQMRELESHDDAVVEHNGGELIFNDSNGNLNAINMEIERSLRNKFAARYSEISGILLFAFPMEIYEKMDW